MYKNESTKNAAKVMKAYLDDYKKGLHVRGISKAVKISPSAASYMTKNLEKLRVLDSVIEGRNKKYFVNFGNPAVKGMIAAAEIGRKTDTAEKYFVIKKLLDEADFGSCIAVLFGSFAKGTAGDNSDIDLLLIGRRNPAVEEKLKKFGNIYKKQVHAMHMGESDFIAGEKREFVNEILKSHVVLNGTEEFVNMMWRIYRA